MFKLMLITNDVDLAKYAIESGVHRIFVDLEVNGKFERQGHLDTLISNHSLQDVGNVRAAIPNNELLVRINPYFPGSKVEIEQVITFGADIIMLPMFTSAQQVQEVSNIIAGRAQLIPLVETVLATKCIEEVVSIKGVSEIYIGLNDLHLDLNLKFMFEPLSNGLVESLALVIKKAGLPFGFGGLARIGEGALPAELILAEHVRLGSTIAILSRTFHRQEQVSQQIKNRIFKNEVNKLLTTTGMLKSRNKKMQQADKKKVENIVNNIKNNS